MIPVDLRWSDEYRIDGGVLDSEHRKFLEIAGRIFKVVNPSREPAYLKEGVRQLFFYMESHFRREEEFAKRIQYPEYPSLRHSHEELVAKVNEVIKTSTNLFEIHAGLCDVVIPMIFDHMKQDDRELSLYYSIQGDPNNKTTRSWLDRLQQPELLEE